MVHVVKWWMKNTDVTYSDIKILYFMPMATCPSLKKKKKDLAYIWKNVSLKEKQHWWKNSRDREFLYNSPELYFKHAKEYIKKGAPFIYRAYID